MASMEQTTIARTDGADLSAATTDRRAGRALPITHWRRILAALCLAGAGLVGQSAHVPLAHAAGNSDAAHACQNGGFSNLAGLGSGGQIITFTNEGDCVSFAAHGGQFTTPIPLCTVTATMGCLVFNNTTLPEIGPGGVPGDGSSFTLTGATTFDDTCTTGTLHGPCEQSPLPNALATGGGDYVETSSSGAVTSQGIYRVADTAGSQEGLLGTGFVDSTNAPVACPTASQRLVLVGATLIDKSGATQTAIIGLDQGQGGVILGGVSNPTDTFAGPVPSSTVTC